MPKLQLAYEGLFNKTMNVTRLALDQMVETAKDDIPVIVSHYQYGEFAGGWVRSDTLKTEMYKGKYSLTAQVDYLPPLKAALDNEELKHWSILALPVETDNAYRLFHLAFLGANLPGIPGLEKISDTISASKNVDTSMDGALILEYKLDSMPKEENNMEIKELQEEIGKLKLQISTVTESKDAELVKIKADLEKSNEEKEALKLERDNLAKSVELQATKEFDALLLELDTAGAEKMPAEDLKSLVAEYKEQGIECKAQVERQIRVLKLVNAIAPNGKPIIMNKDAKAAEEAAKAEHEATHPKGM